VPPWPLSSDSPFFDLTEVGIHRKCLYQCGLIELTETMDASPSPKDVRCKICGEHLSGGLEKSVKEHIETFEQEALYLWSPVRVSSTSPAGLSPEVVHITCLNRSQLSSSVLAQLKALPEGAMNVKLSIVASLQSLAGFHSLLPEFADYIAEFPDARQMMADLIYQSEDCFSEESGFSRSVLQRFEALRSSSL
jgi:hypothetical protein